MVPGLT